MSNKEFDIIGHSLGINVHYAKVSKKKKDKKLPKEYWRNHFQASEGHDDWTTLLELEKSKLLTKRIQFGEPVFHVTEKGKEMFKIKFNEVINKNYD